MSVIEKMLDAQNHYVLWHEFTPVDVPYIVDRETFYITCPKQFEPIAHSSIKGSALVGSAEQSFLQLYKDKKLPLGRFIAVTPCFRPEPVLDETHLGSFMKAELIVTDGSIEPDELAEMAARYFKELLEFPVEIIETKEGYDVECLGIELGSYGFRKCEFLEWVYGTALAEPRLSIVKEKINALSRI